MKLKTVKMVEGKGVPADTSYGDNDIAWGFCSPISKDSQVTLHTRFGFCREGVTGIMFQHLNGIAHHSIDPKKIRLAARIVLSPYVNKIQRPVQVRNFSAWMKTGVSMVNILEEKHGWPLTEMYQVKHNHTKNLLVRMFVGSNNWMRSPAMVSMFALLIRAGKIKRFKGVKTHIGLMKAAAKCKRGETNDQNYVLNSYKYWDLLVGEFDRLFDGITYKEAYKAKNYDQGYRVNEGINKLCKGDSTEGTDYRKLATRFAKISKEYGLK